MSIKTEYTQHKFSVIGDPNAKTTLHLFLSIFPRYMLYFSHLAEIFWGLPCSFWQNDLDFDWMSLSYQSAEFSELNKINFISSRNGYATVCRSTRFQISDAEDYSSSDGQCLRSHWITQILYGIGLLKLENILSSSLIQELSSMLHGSTDKLFFLFPEPAQNDWEVLWNFCCFGIVL